MITTGQLSSGTASALLVRVPPGMSTLVLTGGALGAFYGGSGVTTANGASLPAGAIVTIPGYVTSTETALYVASTAATVVSFALSTDS